MILKRREDELAKVDNKYIQMGDGWVNVCS